MIKSFILCVLLFSCSDQKKFSKKTDKYAYVGELLGFSKQTIPYFEGTSYSHFNTRNEAAKKLAEKMAAGLQNITDEFDPSSTESSYGMCGTYSYLVKKSLVGRGVELERFFSENGHVHLRPTDNINIIVDPSIRQFVNHEGIGDIFVGTRDELREFLNNNPNSIVNTSSSSNVDESLRRIWGIE